MSGHEKFYTPHDDLQELIGVIETLNTNVTTLNSNIVTLTELYLSLVTEDYVTGAATNTSQTEILTPIETVIDENNDVYVKRIVVQGANLGGDPIVDYSSDAIIDVYYGDDTILLYESLFDLNRVTTWIGGTISVFGRTFQLDNIRVPAGETLTAYIMTSLILENTAFYIYIYYSKRYTT